MARARGRPPRRRTSRATPRAAPKEDDWDSWLAEQRRKETEPPPPPPPPPAPYTVLWANRDQRIESWPRTLYVPDMAKLLGDLGPHLGEQPNVYISPKDTWGHDRPNFRMTFADREIGLDFAPHGSKKVGAWAHLFDLHYHDVLGYVEINLESRFETMVNRLKKMMDEATEKIPAARQKDAIRLAADEAFIDRTMQFAETYPEFDWTRDAKDIRQVGFELPYTSGSRIATMRGRLASDHVLIQSMFIQLSDELFAELMDWLRKNNGFIDEETRVLHSAILSGKADDE